MEIACDDIIKQRLLLEIKKKENVLKNSYTNLKKQTMENNFFQYVLDDYENYFTYIKEDKQKQLEVLQKIYDHLEKIKIKTGIIDDKTKNLLNDQNNILGRLSYVRDELQELTQ